MNMLLFILYVRVLWLPLSVMLSGLIMIWLVYLWGMTDWQLLDRQLTLRKADLDRSYAQQHNDQSWRTIPVAVIERYKGLQQSGQWGDQSRLRWLQSIERLPHDVIQKVTLRFSQRQPLPIQRIAHLTSPPLQIQVESLQIDAVARHEWHALKWMKLIDQTILPTGLLQSCELQRQDNHDVMNHLTEEGMVHINCRWLLMEIKE